jgi:LacI family transcriptional regulator
MRGRRSEAALGRAIAVPPGVAFRAARDKSGRNFLGNGDAQGFNATGFIPGKADDMARPTDKKTMAEIARRCRISKSTVSRALSQPAERCLVAPPTRERILRVARELKYRPNWRGRALSSGKTNTVGLIITGLLPQNEAIPHQLLESFSRVLRNSGYHLALVPIDGALDWRDLVFGGHVDGCATINDPPLQVVQEIIRSELPAVAMNATPNIGLPVVTADDFQGGRTVGHYLYELGHRRIAMYVNQSAVLHYSQRERLRGIIDGMSGRGTDDAMDQDVVVQFVRASHESAVQRLLEAPPVPSAIVCYSHYEALPILKEIALRGLRVPDDISLITFNDVFPLDCTLPAITRMSVPADKMGEEAGHQLLAQIAGGARPREPKPRIFTEELIIRDSCAAARVA